MDNKKRTIIQGIAVLVQNANFKGFFTGKIYEGASKQVCVPGLNCYSCPGAVGACPIGALQNTISGFQFKFPYYVLGLLIFFGAILGRIVCGFLCPFGFLQDMLHKIPFPKKIKSFQGDRLLRKLKYFVLLLMVIILPVFIKLTPVYCKYLCPSGTLSGVLLAVTDTALFGALGKLFTWKFSLLIIIIFGSIMIYRPFCKYLCPLGAFYALFNKVSVVQLCVDKEKCTNCRRCRNVCDMCVNPAENPADLECIRCGKCVHSCPTNALYFVPNRKRMGKVSKQPENTVPNGEDELK